MSGKTVFICVQVKNTKKYLRNLFDQINKLDYPRQLISLSILENDSVDGSYEYIVSDILPSLKGYKRVVFEKKDIGFHLLHEKRHIPEVQAERCKAFKTLRQHVMSNHYGYEDYYWIIDSDFTEIPQDFINVALSHDKHIMMAPTYLPNDVLYDLTSGHEGLNFKELAEKNPNDSILELSCVDGAFFCKREVIEAGCNYFEADEDIPDGIAFSQSARDKGFKLYGLMNLKVTHADVGGMEGYKLPVENSYKEVDMFSGFAYETVDTSHDDPIVYLLNEHNEPVMHISNKNSYHIGIHMRETNSWSEIPLSHFKSSTFDRIHIDVYGVHINGINVLQNHLGVFNDALQRSVKVKYLYRTRRVREDFSEAPTGNLVGAFYYGWYKENDWRASCARYKKYGGSPELGWYRSLDERTIEAHIDQASSSGINFFIVSYDGSEYSNYFLSVMAAAAKKKDFKICVHYELTNVFGDPVNVNNNFYEHFKKAFRFLSPLLGDSIWFRMDEKPVIFFYASRAIQGSLEEVVSIRKLAAESGIPDLYIFGDEIWWDKKPNALNRLLNLDAIYGYNMYIPGDVCENNFYTGKNYLEFINTPYRDFLQLAKDAATLVAPTIMPRYDDSAVRSIKNHYPIAAEDGEFFKSYYQWAKQFFYGNQKVLLVTSYNEWYEDSQIEPYITNHEGDDYDKEPSYGDCFLNLIKDFKQDMSNK